MYTTRTMAKWVGCAGHKWPRALVQALLVLVIVVFQAGRVESAPLLITASRIQSCSVSACCLQAAGQTIGPVTSFVPPTSLPAASIRPRLSLQTAFANATYLAQYQRAVQLMKQNGMWDAQRRCHCAYSTSTAVTNVHGRWLFLTWHRWYLYFHEKMMQRVLNDTTFRLPFWNWDASIGRLVFPQYSNTASSLYDSLRNPSSSSTQSQLNSATSTVQMQAAVRNSPDTSTFHGLQGGGSGTVEGSPHGGVHVAVGTQSGSFRDMGSLSYASNDALFYVHHNNVDRLWSVWRTLPSGPNGPRIDPTSTDWLNTQFIFYDEQMNLRSVLVRDSVNTSRLGYTFENVPNPWNTAKRRRRQLLSDSDAAVDAAAMVTRPETSLNYRGRRLHQSPSPPIPIDAPVATGPLIIAAESTTVTLKLQQRERRSGIKPLVLANDGKMKKRGVKNSEVFQVKGLQFSEDRPVYMNFFLNNPLANIDTEPSYESRFCGSFVNMPTGQVADGQLPAPKDVYIPLSTCLIRAGCHNDPAIQISIVSYFADPDTGARTGLPSQFASMKSTSVTYI